MPPKAVATPTAAQLHETFKDKVDEFDSMSDCVETIGKTPDSDTLMEMNTIIITVKKLASDLKEVDLSHEANYPEVEVEKKRICVQLMKFRQAREQARDKALRADMR